MLLQARSILISAIMRKMTKLSNNARKQLTIGQITNLMSVDANKILQGVFHLAVLILSPTAILLAVFFIYKELGLIPVLPCIGVLAVLVTLNATVISKYGEVLQREQLKAKDSRTKVISTFRI